MSDLFENLACELNKNNVSIEIHRVASPNLLAIGENIVLDFSEHDKVFEDKIASLEENVGYYKDSLSRVEKNCDKLYHENQELKQRIAELESKETEKPTKYITVIVAKEINGQEYVRLEDFMSVVNNLQAQIGT